MTLSPLTAITPIDGRYYNTSKDLSNYFSEFALIKYRVLVEVEYFIALSESGIPQLSHFDGSLNDKLRDIYKNFSLEDAQWIKETEKVTNHDVKAVEYFLKNEFEKLGLHDSLEFIHFGLTSQDINNTAIPHSWKDALKDVYHPAINELLEELKKLSAEWENVSMLARTHGQPASPTRLGKEIKVFVERIEKQLTLLKQVPFSAKFGGATGNFNAHHVAYPNNDWVAFGNKFVNETLGLDRSQTTTQIEHYDNFAASCDGLKRINNIIIDLCRDVWTYISMDYFKQKITAGQIGSSAMPHKVNPIDFENAEGNLGLANAVLEHLAAKLPISRLQRDLTDSTVLRNIGVPFSYTLIAIKSTLRGLRKLILNEAAFQADLENNWAVVAEAIQTILRREGYPKPYEALKDLTRTNTHVTKDTIAAFVDQLNVTEEVKEEIKAISPSNYTGVKL
ncbi:adenylosuccinate lyase [Sphingobacterium mizutaii NBRC 14946 = DSM 11724]|uniref:Adenylosuccinate lyase n=2 Tax=Sphingobacterium mizutaii TaxID=1010 RepID=A0AAJ5BZ68_9SPHI|nr:adenylosuccinate lyase [Sphingobacterium mizutaii]GEM67480.1 adenylosuccinate lyase [Sphingobacterium mizutaii NBRC 14946 = DSM 11724]SDL39502.1 adenylosuccinate lyase [Sphingobacterium mizutaii]SNV44079.1 Adenylosuccinate lyase [Sphingobacterium mizutaii]